MTNLPIGDERPLGLRERVREYETALIIEALERAGGNQLNAAVLLRIPLRTLVYKLGRFGIREKLRMTSGEGVLDDGPT